MNKQLKLVTARAGELTVRVVEDGDRAGPPRALVVLCHGYGAPGTDLVGLAGELCSVAPQLLEARFVFPEAPLSLDNVPFGGRAWWEIDVGRFASAMARGDLEQLMDETPEGLPRARKLLLAALEQLCAAAPSAPLVLGGFSQGAMLATDTALRMESAPAALAIFSGTLLSRAQWVPLARKRVGLRVLQCHGNVDPILPYAAALELQRVLQDAGLNVQFHAFMGGHGIDGEALELCAGLVVDVMGKAAGQT